MLRLHQLKRIQSFLNRFDFCRIHPWLQLHQLLVGQLALREHVDGLLHEAAHLCSIGPHRHRPLPRWRWH